MYVFVYGCSEYGMNFPFEFMALVFSFFTYGNMYLNAAFESRLSCDFRVSNFLFYLCEVFGNWIYIGKRIDDALYFGEVLRK